MSAGVWGSDPPVADEVDERVKSRKWVFTINNPTKNCIKSLTGLAVPEICVCIGYQLESGEECGTPHYQGFVVYKSVRSQKTVRMHLGGRTLPQVMRGTVQQSIDYCSKSKTKIGEYVQRGEPPAEPGRGARTDLKKICDSIRGGETSVSKILVEDPYTVHQYGRVLQMTETAADATKMRKWKTKVIWAHGPTGTGKSAWAFSDVEDPNVFVYTKDQEWWDGYTGQEIIVIDDIRKTDFRYAWLLRLLDRYPVKVPRRSLPPQQILAKEIRITCPMTPEELFGDSTSDDIAQMLRRCNEGGGGIRSFPEK